MSTAGGYHMTDTTYYHLRGLLKRDHKTRGTDQQVKDQIKKIQG
jgi:hypothetical protein